MNSGFGLVEDGFEPTGRVIYSTAFRVPITPRTRYGMEAYLNDRAMTLATTLYDRRA